MSSYWNTKLSDWSVLQSKEKIRQIKLQEKLPLKTDKPERPNIGNLSWRAAVKNWHWTYHPNTFTVTEDNGLKAQIATFTVDYAQKHRTKRLIINF